MKKLLILTCLFASFAAHAAEVRNLRCENTVDPSGIDNKTPGLSWIMTSSVRGDMQSAYRILVASSPELLKKDKGDMWDTGKVGSDKSVGVAYAGKALEPDRKYYWKVRIWDAKGNPAEWSEPAQWQTGLLSMPDWEGAQWIAYKDGEQWREEWRRHKQREMSGPTDIGRTWPWFTGKDSTVFALYEMADPKYDPSPLFRKEFTAGKKIESASLYICGLGYYEAFINGRRVGDNVLDPAWTNFEQRSMYVTHDVTDLLRKGGNAIGVMLGRGQYNPLCNDIWGLYKSAWVDQPKLIAMLSIRYGDGTTERIVTDGSWKTAGGPIVYDDTRHGELYDARLEQPGWSLPEFDDGGWKNASRVEWTARLTSQTMPPIKCFAPVAPARTFPRGDGMTVYDIGANLSGWARVTVKGPAGAKVLVEYCETPSDRQLVSGLPDSRFDYNIPDKFYASFYDKCVNIRQQNGYILRGEGEETFECRFSYKGFQFVRVTADPGVTVSEVAGIPVHTDVAKNGDFRCSDPAVNRMQENSVISMLNNFHSIATDCPHREKQGWTADNYMTSQAAIYNFDMQNFYNKWIVDLAGTQDASGGLCTVAPSTGYDMATSTSWPAAIVLIPWDVYKFYGDKSSMRDNYDVMARFAKSSLNRQVEGKPEIIRDVLGDWVAPLDDLVIIDGRRNNTMPPPEGLTIYGTAAHFLVVRKLSEISAALGREKEAAEAREWSARIADAFNREFFDEETATYHGEVPTGYRQAANVVPLQYGIVADKHRKVVSDNLQRDVRTRGDRLATGFLGTPALMEYLAVENPQMAYNVATQKEYPGWGYMVEQGANSMWETWDGYDSRSHTPFCLISGYFYKYLAGIQPDIEDPGFKHIVIDPTIPEGLEYVDAYHDSPYGRIESGWKKENSKLTLNITIPANTTATIHIPAAQDAKVTESGTAAEKVEGLKFAGREKGKNVYEAGAGSYTFISEL